MTQFHTFILKCVGKNVQQLHITTVTAAHKIFKGQHATHIQVIRYFNTGRT